MANELITKNIGNLFGVDKLNPEEKKMYYEILEEGGETTPLHVRRAFPDKEKAKMGVRIFRKKKAKKSKSKRKTKGCGCK